MGRPKSALAEQSLANEYVGTKDAAAILGMSVSSVQKLVNGGKLEAWRTEGGHRRISIRSIQAVARESHRPKASEKIAQRAAKSTSSAPLRVLIVEDNPVVSKALGRLFERYGPNLQIEFTTDAGVALLKIAEGMPNLVITDLAMAPFDGFHLIRVLRNAPRYAAINLVVITGLSDKEILARGGVEQGIVVYRKPVSHERLAGFIDALLQQRLVG